MLTRRRLLNLAGSLAGLSVAPAVVRATSPLTSTAKGATHVLHPFASGEKAPRATFCNGTRWARFPFTLGVASGLPRPDGFVIWTRLAPEPLSADPATPGGMTVGDVPLTFEVATDESMRDVVRTGKAVARARYAHSVRVEVRGLKPDRPYWYRFTCADAQSRIGRSRTTPRAGAPLKHLRFGFVSCSNYETGYFAAYRHLADEQPDLVMFLGDYIYEFADSDTAKLVRRHSDGVHATTLATYRNRYAQYRLDEDLQRLHAAAPALLTWDDHELQNDYGGLLPPDFDDPARFRERRCAAYQAYYEHMPVAPAREPDGPNLRIYDRTALGDLAEVFMTDARQYRSPAPCYGAPGRPPGRVITLSECSELYDTRRSLLGAQQEGWLKNALARSKARWNIVGQSLLLAQMHRKNKLGEAVLWTDDWNGYPESRKRLLRHLHTARVANPVFLSGDIHSFWANDLKLNFDQPDSPTVGTEFVGSSVSANPPTFDFAAALPDNPHVRFFDKSVRGYVSVDLTPERMTTRFQAISDRRDPQATVSTLKTFIVESGRAGPTAI